MTQPHKHHDCIVAWAKGSQIQYKSQSSWRDVTSPSWDYDTEYRVKPEPKPDVVKYKYISKSGSTFSRYTVTDNGSAFAGLAGHLPNLKITLDGETGQLKSAEVI